jgi:hypothetical protein
VPHSRFQQQETDGIGHVDFKRFHFVTVAYIDAQDLYAVFQIFGAVQQAQIETAFRAIDFENGFVFFDAWQIGQQVELHNVAIDFFLISE